MKRSMKFAGMLTTALVAPALFASAASAQSKEYLAKATAAQISELKGQTSARAVSGTLDRVKMWNEVMLQANLVDHSTGAGQLGPTRNSRAFAIVSIAVFDAVNAFNGRFQSYNPVPRALAGASRDAAITEAAYRTLIALHPAQATTLTGIYSSDLSRINASAAAVAAGRAIGAESARQMLARRSNDGSQHTEPRFGDGAAPGDVGGVVAGGSTVGFLGKINAGNTTAPNFTQATGSGVLGSRWGNVTPFVLNRGDQFRIPPFPTPNTRRFREGFVEVTRRGADFGVPGGAHTATDSFIGNFWGYDGQPLLGTPPRLYNQIAVSIAEDQGLTSVSEFTRLLALVNTTMGDSGIAAWDSKWFYNYWRPNTGVVRGGEAGDPTIQNIPGWRPFGISILNNTGLANLPRAQQSITPGFPAYPSGHATFGAALFGSLRAYFPNNTRFTFVSDEYNGTGTEVKGGEPARAFVPVRYRSFQEAQEENGDSRIANGVHWEWDDTDGQNLGTNIVRFTVANAFQRR
jgi:membrane-associated phospholipid phosphatase